MATAHKGVRIQQTVRLPASLHRAAAGLARERSWSLNQYITDCVKAQVASQVRVPVPSGVGERQNIRAFDDDGNVVGTL